MLDHGYYAYMENCLKKPLMIVGWGRAECSTWSRSPYATAYMHISPGYLDARTEERMWFGSCSDLAGYFYDGLGMEGYVNSDHAPGNGVYLDGVGYKNSSRLKLNDVSRMARTLARLDKREEKWRNKQTGDRYGAESELRAFYYALNAQKVWLCEGDQPKDGRLVGLECAIDWIFKRGHDLALQCRILTGKHEGKITAFTSAPLNYDGFAAEQVAWLPYMDNRGNRYREVRVEGQNWIWYLGRTGSGWFGLFQAHEFEAMKPILKPWEGDDGEPENIERVTAAIE